jgi:hypothetical protein
MWGLVFVWGRVFDPSKPSETRLEQSAVRVWGTYSKNIFAQPEGATANSPALQRRVYRPMNQSPVGTTETPATRVVS